MEARMFQISYYDDCSKLHTVNVESSTPEEALMAGEIEFTEE